MAFENVFMRLKAVIEAETDGFSSAMARARSEARETADYVDRQRGTVDIDADIADFEAKAARVAAATKRIDAMKADVEIDADTSKLDAALRDLERQDRMLQSRLSKLYDRKASSQMGSDFRELTQEVKKTNQEADRGRRSWFGFGKSLADVRIQLGFTSLNVRQLGAAMVFLSPIILGLIGTLSALIGVAGEGLVGAALGGGAAITALGLSFIGIKAAMAPALADMAAGQTAFKALTDAQRKYGKNSQEAKDAQKAYNETLKNMDPAAAKALQSWNKLSQGFQNRTGATRDNIFGMMADGIERAKALMPAFAQSTNQVSAALRDAGQRFLTAFDSSSMQSAMQTIMGNFANALPALGEALGNIAEGISNIFASASRHFGPIADGILEWSRGFNQANQAGSELNSRVDDLMASAESMVHFFAAAGRVLLTFFGAGSAEGKSMVDDMTAGLNKWNEWMKSAEGQNSLASFFQETTDMGRQLWGTVSNLLPTIERFAEIFTPAVDVATDLLNVILDIVQALQSIPGIGTAITAALGASMLTKLPIIGGLIGGVGGKVAGAVGAKILGTAASGAFGGAAAAAAQRAIASRAAAVTAATAAETGLASAVGGSTGALGAFAAAAAPAALAIGAILAPTYAITKALGLQEVGLNDTARGWATAIQGQREFRAASMQAFTQLGQGRSSITSVRQGVLALKDAYAQSNAAGKSAFIGLKDAITQARVPLRESAQGIKDWRDNLETANFGVQQLGERFGDNPVWEQALDSIKRTGTVTDETREKLLGLGATETEIDSLANSFGDMDRVIARTARQTAALDKQFIDASRTAKGMSQLNISTGAVQRMESQIGRKRTMEILMKVDDSDAARKIARVTNMLSAMGRRNQVIDILARSDNAEQALRRLQNLKQQASKPLTVQMKDGVSRVAAGAMKAVKMIPERHDTKIDAQDGASAVAKGVTGAINSVPKTHSSRITADASAAIATARAAAAAINGMTAVLRVQAMVSGMPNSGRFMGGPLTPQPGEIPGYASGGGFVNKPLFMVGEEAPRHPEFVIATNPAYRTDNIRYWMQAAAMLGIPGFAKGGSRGYKTGAIGVDIADREFTQADRAYDRAKEQKQKREDKLKELRSRATDKEKGNDPTGAQMEAARKDLEQAKAAFERAERRRDIAKKHRQQARRENKVWEALRGNITRAEAEAQAAAATGDNFGWATWRDRGIRYIDDLIGQLSKAARGASGPRKTELQTEIANLVSQKQALAEGRPGVEGMLNRDEAQRLSDIERQTAEARLTAGITDDQLAAKGLTDFWESVYNRLTKPGSGATNEMITDAANRLADAREAQLSGAGSGGGIIPQGAIFSNERMNLYRQFGSNVDWQAAAVSPFSGSPGPAAAAGGNTVNNYFPTPPPDPHTWAQQQAFELGAL